MIQSFRHNGLERFFLTGSRAGIQLRHASRLRLILARLHASTGFCRKVRFWGKIQKSGVRNSMAYRCQHSRKSNFATEPEELAFDWTLSERDITFILTNHRGPENLCRIAVQLCVLRKHGRFLANYLQVSPPVLGYLCRQLDLAPLVALSGPVRGNTESDYQRDIAQYLGWHPFDAEIHTWLREWIVEQVAQHLYVEDLVEKTSERLRTHRIILPSRTLFARLVHAAHADAEHRIFTQLAQHLSEETKQAIDGLLGVNAAPVLTGAGVPAPEDSQDFYRFAAYPPEAKAKHIVIYLERYGEISPLDLTPLQRPGVSPELLERLSTAVRTYDVEQHRRFAADQRYALAAAFLFDTRKRLLDFL